MLTATEKRFLKHWEEQRKGGMQKYLLLYILAGTFVGTIILSFLTAIFAFGFPHNLLLIVAGSFCLVTVISVLSWQVNEKKFKGIIQREVKEGMEKDRGSEAGSGE